jgi:hypothetical protein
VMSDALSSNNAQAEGVISILRRQESG